MLHKVFIVAQRCGDSDFYKWLCKPLQAAGHAVACEALDGRATDSIASLRAAFHGRPPAVVIVDVTSLPDLLLLSHVNALMREAWGDAMPTPPPCLAVLDQSQLSYPDLPAFADDFLMPSAAPEELLARLRMMLFRHGNPQAQTRLAIADTTIDLDAGLAYGPAGEPLPLTPKEYDLLRFLTEHRGTLFTRDKLLDMVWGLEYHGGERTIDIHIRRLRSKLSKPAAELLETRRGVGYGVASTSS